MPDPVLTAALLYGGIGGLLGISLSIYLYRVRNPPAHPALVFAVYAIGFTMVMATLALSHGPVSRAAKFTIIFFEYTLLILAQLLLFATHTHPDARVQIRGWMFDTPRFVPESWSFSHSTPENSTDNPAERDHQRDAERDAARDRQRDAERDAVRDAEHDRDRDRDRDQ